MSFNDRAGEAMEVLLHGGTLPDTPEVREMVVSVLEDAKAGGRVPDGLRAACKSILAANPEQARHVEDGQWYEEPLR